MVNSLPILESSSMSCVKASPVAPVLFILGQSSCRRQNDASFRFISAQHGSIGAVGSCWSAIRFFHIVLFHRAVFQNKKYHSQSH